MRCASLVLVAVTLMIASGCSQQPMSMEPPKMEKPAPAPEMAQLERLVGNWTGTAEFISPTAEEMQEMMPEGEEMPTSFAGEAVYEWTLDGMFLHGAGWHEMGAGERMSYQEYVTWDAKAGKFRSWYFSDWGEYGESWWKPDPDGETFWIKGKGRNASGAEMVGEGKMVFTDDDTQEWEWSEKGPMGKIKLGGVSHRQ